MPPCEIFTDYVRSTTEGNVFSGVYPSVHRDGSGGGVQTISHLTPTPSPDRVILFPSPSQLALLVTGPDGQTPPKTYRHPCDRVPLSHTPPLSLV